MKKFIILGGIIACLLCFASGAHARSVAVSCAKSDANPIYDSHSKWLSSGCLVQIISSDTNVGIPTTPDATGKPTGAHETVTYTGTIGNPADGCGPGEFYALIANIPGGMYVYMRAWDGSTVGASGHYGNAAVIGPLPGAGGRTNYSPPSFSTTWDAPAAPKIIGKISCKPAEFESGNGTMFTYALNVDSDVQINIYEKKRLVYKQDIYAGKPGGKAGHNEVFWRGVSSLGRPLGNGKYAVIITSGNSRLAKTNITIKNPTAKQN